ncbi:MAG: hypothetical protein IPN32_33070 [Deltaproteobacteria bacterium]|nr:hypothetical protein [Deltaproteobacteria bacterium]
MTLTVSAPGKAFLIGEYAVLEGAPAYVTAVDVRAVAHDASDDRPAASSAVVSCAHARTAAFLRGPRGRDRLCTAVRTGGFTLGHRKLGLGSSAAVAAAVVGYHLAAAGLELADDETRTHALALAQAAHAESQGGTGSGADVATAVHGATIRFVDRQVDAVTLPGWLSLGFVDAGAPAVTSSFVCRRCVRRRPMPRRATARACRCCARPRPDSPRRLRPEAAV